MYRYRWLLLNQIGEEQEMQHVDRNRKDRGVGFRG